MILIATGIVTEIGDIFNVVEISLSIFQRYLRSQIKIEFKKLEHEIN